MEQSELNKHQGVLVTSMGMSPEFSADFNQWYDREHTLERVGIRGFLNGSRYEAVRAFPQYFCLYRTQNLDVFRSNEYRQAFQHQTSWSVTNLNRFLNAFRRVCAIVCQTGGGTGGFISVLKLGRLASDQDLTSMAESGKAAQAMEGVVATRLLVPSMELSTPLPTEETKNRLLDPLLVLDATTEAAASAAGEMARAKLNIEAKNMLLYRLMWDLRKEDV